MKLAPMFIVIALLVAGCANSSEKLAPVVAAGPQFVPARFECGKRPLPPDEKLMSADKQGSAAAAYEQQLKSWGQACSNKLGSVRNELEPAGQIVGKVK
jgi:hypothetical protein